MQCVGPYGRFCSSLWPLGVIVSHREEHQTHNHMIDRIILNTVYYAVFYLTDKWYCTIHLLFIILRWLYSNFNMLLCICILLDLSHYMYIKIFRPKIPSLLPSGGSQLEP